EVQAERQQVAPRRRRHRPRALHRQADRRGARRRGERGVDRRRRHEHGAEAAGQARRVKKLLAIAFLTLACAREQHPPQLVPKRCDGLCGRVVDAKTKQPIREFTVYMLAPHTTNAPSRQIKLPPGYPQPVGELIEERVIESTDGAFVLRTPPLPVYVAVSARGYKSMTTAAPVEASTEVKIELA